jgi:pimeloyl-ACP methyl ester carboxylesterase
VSSRGCAAETGDFAWEAEYCNVQEENDFPVPPECMRSDIIPKLYEISDQNLQRPLMIFHGDSDPVCPLSQSKQCMNILRQRGAKNVSLTVYRGEGHGFRDKDVRADCIAKLVDFFAPEVVIRLCLSDFFCVNFFFSRKIGNFFLREFPAI